MELLIFKRMTDAMTKVYKKPENGAQMAKKRGNC